MLLDILGREVNRGDIIVYGNIRLSGFNKFATTELGVVSGISRGGRVYDLKDMHTKQVVLDGNNKPIQLTTIDKVIFYPFALNDVNLPSNTSRYKNGKPKHRKVVFTNSFIKLNIEDLDDKWKAAYDVFKQEFKL